MLQYIYAYDAIRRIQALRDEQQRVIDEYDVPGQWLDEDGSWRDWESEASARETEGARDAYDRALDILQALAHGIEPAQGAPDA